jgi:Ni,Fe-hydrogenase III large subunit
MTALPRMLNGSALPLSDVPALDFDRFRPLVCDVVRTRGARVSAFFGHPEGSAVRVFAVLNYPDDGTLSAMSTVVGDRYPSLTPDCPPLHWFERELAEQWGVVPEGHPWLKPIRFHPSYRYGRDAWGRTPDAIQPAVTDYFRVEGEEVHEVAVGPVHAGVIEPGHFRFQCHGEWVYHLEISLGYQHRGAEPQFVGGPTKRTLPVMETLAGDTTVGHATAYCEVVEALTDTPVPVRAQSLRGIALELERLANHTGDLGALGQDVGFLPTSAFCGRLRGEFLNATASIAGNRFGRGMVRPGGFGFDVDKERAGQLIERVKEAVRDVGGAAKLLWGSPSVQARFEDCGKVSREAALDLGLVGPAARACGLDRDARHHFPTGIYRYAQVPVAVWPSGDVFARAFVRGLEVERSGRFITDQLATLPDGPVLAPPTKPLRPDALAVSLVEGWRGEVCHVAVTDGAGKFARYKVVDPSFHNWIGLSMALRNQQISDFPLNNKSFNLSYCGHDL